MLHFTYITQQWQTEIHEVQPNSAQQQQANQHKIKICSSLSGSACLTKSVRIHWQSTAQAALVTLQCTGGRQRERAREGDGTRSELEKQKEFSPTWRLKMRTLLKREGFRKGEEDEQLWWGSRSPGLPISWCVCMCVHVREQVHVNYGDLLHLNQYVKLFIMHVHGHVFLVCMCVPTLMWSKTFHQCG